MEKLTMDKIVNLCKQYGYPCPKQEVHPDTRQECFLWQFQLHQECHILPYRRTSKPYLLHMIKQYNHSLLLFRYSILGDRKMIGEQ